MVVIGHSQDGLLHDVIYLFHMPIFFIVSGYLIKEKTILTKEYVLRLFQRLMLPYIIYISIDVLLIQRHVSIGGLGEILYGGRHVSGVYWYITCYFVTLLLFILIKNKLKRKKRLLLVAFFGILSVVESHLTSFIPFLSKPGIPLNLDVVLLAIVYVTIGYEFKVYIQQLTRRTSRNLLLSCCSFTLIVIFYILNFYLHSIHYIFDMKYVIYKELILSVLIPIAFGILIIQVGSFLNLISSCQSCPIWYRYFVHVLNFSLAYLGHISMLIMYLHIPVNYFQSNFQYNSFLYVVIGIGIPICLCQLFGKSRFCQRVFGLKEIEYKKLWDETTKLF